MLNIYGISKFSIYIYSKNYVLKNIKIKSNRYGLFSFVPISFISFSTCLIAGAGSHTSYDQLRVSFNRSVSPRFLLSFRRCNAKFLCKYFRSVVPVRRPLRGQAPRIPRSRSGALSPRPFLLSHSITIKIMKLI